MLSKNRFGSELWLSTERLQVIIGPICSRRKSGQDTRGRQLSDCERIHRRTVQRTIDEAVAAGIIEQVLEANVWVGRGKHRTFRRSATYALRAERLKRQQTWEEYYAEKPHPPRSSHRSSPPAQAAAASPAQSPPPTAAPVHVAPPQRDHTRINEPPPGSRAEKRILDLRREVLAKWDELKRGHTRHVEAVGGYGYDLSPGDPRYVAPVSPEKAWTMALMFCSVTEKEARERLKLSFGKLEDPEPSP